VNTGTVNTHCHLVNGSKANSRLLTNGNYISTSIIKSVKNLVKTSINRNPDKNNKFIKNTFTKRLQELFVGKVIKTNKYIMSIKSVQVRRIKKSLRYVIIASPMWKLVDSKQQIYQKKVTMKDKRFVCWLRFNKKLKSTCYMNKKKAVMQLRTDKTKVKTEICRFESKAKALIKGNIAYIDCSDGAIQPSNFRITNPKAIKKAGSVPKVETKKP